jgi:hypothetical protein
MKTLSHTLACLLASIVTCGGCAEKGAVKEESSPVNGKDYSYSAVDLPMEQRFKLTLVSTSRRELCITSDSWPTEAGNLDNASQNTFIAVGGRQYSYKNVDIEACPFKACGNPLSYGMHLESRLFYKDFALPSFLFSSPKELLYRPRPFWCDESHWIDRPGSNKR